MKDDLDRTGRKTDKNGGKLHALERAPGVLPVSATFAHALDRWPNDCIMVPQSAIM